MWVSAPKLLWGMCRHSGAYCRMEHLIDLDMHRSGFFLAHWQADMGLADEFCMRHTDDTFRCYRHGLSK